MDSEGTHGLHERTCYLLSKMLQERILLDSIRAGLQIPDSNGNTPTAFTACNGTRVCWFSSSRPLSDTRSCTHAQPELMQGSFSTKRTGLDNVPATNTHMHGPATQKQIIRRDREPPSGFCWVCAEALRGMWTQTETVSALLRPPPLASDSQPNKYGYEEIY